MLVGRSAPRRDTSRTIGLNHCRGHTAVNYRLKPDDIAYIFDHADAEAIIVDAEFEPLLESYHASHPGVPFLVDLDNVDVASGAFPGPYEDAVR